MRCLICEKHLFAYYRYSETCLERPPVLKDHQFWAESLHISVTESVTKDHLSRETIYL